jgi:DNA-binding GntR family transcriptional regulator
LAQVVTTAGTHARRSGSKVALVYEQLRAAIVGLQLEPGTRIDKAELCGRLGVSRQPVAEALAHLAEERLVVVEPQKGTYVARIKLADVVEAAFVRQALEVAVSRQIAPDIDNATLERLERIVSYQAAAGKAKDTEEFYAFDVRFHATLFDRLAYRRAAEVVESCRAQTERIRRLLVPSGDRSASTIAEHQAIVGALKRRSADASAAAMRAHLESVMNELWKFAAARPELFEA